MRVWLTGSGGMLGSNIVGTFAQIRPGDHLIATDRDELDLRDADAVARFVSQSRPDAIIHTAAVVGGIVAKVERPTTFLLDNLRIDSALIAAAVEAEVPSLLYVSSAAIYPADAPQPISEEALFRGPLEPANEPYSLAKLTGTRLCAFASRQFGYHYRAVAPANLYGPGDDYTPGRAHLVASALDKVAKAHDQGQPTVEIWGDGTTRREFVYVGDLARWIVSQIDQLDQWPDLTNLGCGVDHAVREYYEMAASVVGYRGKFSHDLSKPSGVPQRLIDSTRAEALGWEPSTSLADGLAATYVEYRERFG